MNTVTTAPAAAQRERTNVQLREIVERVLPAGVAAALVMILHGLDMASAVTAEGPARYPDDPTMRSLFERAAAMGALDSYGRALDALAAAPPDELAPVDPAGALPPR